MGNRLRLWAWRDWARVLIVMQKKLKFAKKFHYFTHFSFIFVDQICTITFYNEVFGRRFFTSVGPFLLVSMTWNGCLFRAAKLAEQSIALFFGPNLGKEFGVQNWLIGMTWDHSKNRPQPKPKPVIKYILKHMKPCYHFNLSPKVNKQWSSSLLLESHPC